MIYNFECIKMLWSGSPLLKGEILIVTFGLTGTCYFKLASFCPCIQVERINHILHSLVDMVRKGEKPEGRLMSHILFNPSDDGGEIKMWKIAILPNYKSHFHCNLIGYQGTIWVKIKMRTHWLTWPRKWMAWFLLVANSRKMDIVTIYFEFI